MKLNIVPSIISAAFAGLIAYFLYITAEGDQQQLLLTIAGGLFSFLTLWGTMGYTLDEGRKAVNLKVCSGVFFIMVVAVEFVFACTGFSVPTFVIVNGVGVLLWFSMMYSLFRSKQ